MMIRVLQSMIMVEARWSGWSWDWICSVFPMAEMVDPCMSSAPSSMTSRDVLTGMMVAWM